MTSGVPSAYSQWRVRHNLRSLLPVASFVGCGNIYFQDLAIHSGRCGMGTLFVMQQSAASPQAMKHAQEALRRGACGVITAFPLPDLDAPQCVVPDVRTCYGQLCQALAGHPARSLITIGVTGTNGKTTISWFLRSILAAAQKSCGMLGTIEYDDGSQQPEPATLTTPDAGLLADWMVRMQQRRTTHLAMEVSSHALVQQRIAGVDLSAAVISNIGRDHLDYHGDLDAYRHAKMLIFNFCHPAAPVIVNGDDPHVREAITEAASQKKITQNLVTVGMGSHNQVIVKPIYHDWYGIRGELVWEGRSLELAVPLPGTFNLMNASLAAVTALSLGVSEQEVQQGIVTFVPPPGRLQRIDKGQEFACFVDYAHTPDAIENVLASLKPLVAGRLLCLFGAGGDRDREKRPLMGKAARLADVIVLTSDNSRSEPTAQILQEIVSGFPAGRQPDYQHEDRRLAIRWLISQAQPGDCLLLLGKGHETTQSVGENVSHFDDVEVVSQIISEFHSSSTSRLSA